MRALASDDDDDDDDGENWPGNIRKGSHVRCVGTSYGAGNVHIGDIGVVQARDSDGDYKVDFPKKDGWLARTRDVVLDDTAEKIERGSLVRFKPDITTPVLCQQGPWSEPLSIDEFNTFSKSGLTALVADVRHDGIVALSFGQNYEGTFSTGIFLSTLQELEPVDPCNISPVWPGSLQLGQAVRVASDIEEPSTGWGPIERGDVGFVRAYNGESGGFASTIMYKVDFPKADGWVGREGDLEVDPIANRIRPGVRVRVRQGIGNPKAGWGNISSSSVGTVIKVDYDGVPVVVRFPEQSEWKGLLSELEAIDPPPSSKATAGPDVSELRAIICPGGHKLKRIIAQAPMCLSCDWCKASIPSGSVCYSCRPCNTDGQCISVVYCFLIMYVMIRIMIKHS